MLTTGQLILLSLLFIISFIPTTHMLNSSLMKENRDVNACGNYIKQFIVRDTNGSVCMLLKMCSAMLIPIHSNQSLKAGNFTSFMIDNKNYSGDCNESHIFLNISMHQFNISFVWKCIEDESFALLSTYVEYIAPNSGEKLSVSSSVEYKNFHAHIGSHFECVAQQSLDIEALKMTVSYLSIQAFPGTTEEQFTGHETICMADFKPSPVLAITVCVILLSMMLLVIVVYFISRKRHSPRSYDPVIS